ncbi:MAG: hypothetical protein KAH97_03495 [Anaerolineales bacterium]|nr:hypothetical protein [Anaerolineales bacterium]
MNPRMKVWTLCVLVVMVLSLGACKSGEIDQDIIFTFDGEECRYDGPSEVFEGNRIITLKNNTELDIVIDVQRIDDGKTWQDLLEYVDEVGQGQRSPFTSSPIKSLIPGNPEAWEYSLEEGLYGIFCFDVDLPGGIWPGTSLEVKGQ